MRRSSVRRTAPRRKLIWVRSNGSQTLSGGTGLITPSYTDLLALFEGNLGAQLIGCTIMRIRGAMVVGTGATYPAAGITQIRATVHLIDEARIAAPLPGDSAFGSTGQNDDYMAFEPFMFAGASGGAGYSGGTDVQARMIDVKSMRKLEELNQSLVLKVSSLNSVAGGTPSFAHDLSILVALP